MTHPPLRIVSDMAERLAAARVTYCHWKSNESLDEAVAGKHDLDLLFDRSDMTIVGSILHDLGFRVARPTPDRQLPGILDYYGLDAGSGIVVHVHAHTQLALGDDMTKNFRLPIERAYLESASRDGVIPVPSVELEYLVFVIRMVLKHCTWDAQLARRSKLALSERREKSDLEDRVDLVEVDRLRELLLPLVSDRLFEASRRAISGAARPMRVITAERLITALDSLGRRDRLTDLGLRLWRRQYRKRLGRTGSKKRLDGGGLLIAVVGGDGAGKSTTVEAVGNHLSKDLATTTIHLGKPPWSRLSRLVKRPMRKARTFGAFGSTRLPPWTDFDELGFPGYGYLMWHTLIARDRFLEYRRARRAAHSGELVVCDRYPLDAIRMMDGRRLSGLPGVDTRSVARLFRRLEDRYYAKIRPPDLLLVMRTSPEVAIRRRTEDPELFVRTRNEEILAVDWSGLPASVVDATQSLDEVQRQVRSAVWAML